MNPKNVSPILDDQNTLESSIVKEETIEYDVEYLEEAEEEITEVIIEEVDTTDNLLQIKENDDDDDDGKPISKGKISVVESEGKGPFDKKYAKCRFCEVVCSKTYIQRHEKKHLDPIKCPVCHHGFSVNHHLKAHMQRHHPEHDMSGANREDDEDGQTEQLKQQEEFSFPCCGYSFDSLTDLMLHMQQIHFKHFRDAALEHREVLSNIIQCAPVDNGDELMFEEKLVEESDLLEETVERVEAFPNEWTLRLQQKSTDEAMEEAEQSLDAPEFAQNDEPSELVLFICHICGSKRSNKHQLTRHMKKHRMGFNGEPDKSACRHCGFVTRDCDAYKEHLIEYHQRLTIRAQCEFCTKSFVTKYSLLLHYRIRHAEQNFDIPDFVRSDRLSHRDDLEVRAGEFRCYMCKKYFASREKLKQHRKTHSEEDLRVCPYCAKTFNHKKSFAHHVYLKHTHKEKYENKNFVCNECGAGFNSEYNLKTHRGNAHGVGEINFTCSHCLKGFFRINEYEKHMIVHSDVRPFQCATCGRAFKRETSLKMHRENIHDLREEDKTKCLLCEGVFKNQRFMRSHVRKVHKMSLAQAHEALGLPYHGRPMWNSIERKSEICVNNRLYPVPNVKMIKGEV